MPSLRKRLSNKYRVLLQELALTSFTSILRGSVRIEKNPELCYVDTVDWGSILHNGELIAAGNNEEPFCPSCPASCEDSKCWSAGVCQDMSSKKDNCHELCLGGCTGPGPDQCSACVRVVDERAACVESCQPDR